MYNQFNENEISILKSHGFIINSDSLAVYNKTENDSEKYNVFFTVSENEQHKYNTIIESETNNFCCIIKIFENTDIQSVLKNTFDYLNMYVVYN